MFTERLTKQQIKHLTYHDKCAYMRWWFQDQLAGNYNFHGAVIDCYFRHGLAKADTAEVLNTTPEDVDLAIDIIRQNAQ